MKYLIEIAVILTALIQVNACSETLENVKPGDIKIDIGDGYEVSFVLDDAFEVYDIEINDPYYSEVNGSLFYCSYNLNSASYEE